ncbi:MAG: acetyl-CoA carboxylase carboxyl transferase subunit alpha, partial [Syntrophomonas sp.]|nr:acetyl-CoA carboxylase carboxyl transferase subunit alpha [Syntrophomonas sp.]
LSNAVFSVASPETCASILLRDIKRADEMAAALKLNAAYLKDLEIVDEVIDEPVNEHLLDSPDFVISLESSIKKHLDEVCSQTIVELLEHRYLRLRNIGKFYKDI